MFWKIIFVNLITALRLMLLYFLVESIVEGDEEYVFETALWIGMGLTDYFDGLLARKLGASTRLGGYFDIVADKIVTIVIVPILWVYRSFPTWAVVTLAAWVVIWAWQALLFKRRTGEIAGSRLWGKRAFAAWGITTIPFFAGYFQVGKISLVIPAVLSVVAFFDYKKAHGWRLWNKNQPPP